MNQDKMTTETWKKIEHADRFEVSNLGNFRRADKKNGEIHPITPYKKENGYLYVCINRKLVRAHKVVAEAFLGPCPAGMEINHIDEDRTNNAVTNLNYVTHRNNIAWGTCLQRGAENFHGARPVRCVETGVVYRSIR